MTTLTTAAQVLYVAALPDCDVTQAHPDKPAEATWYATTHAGDRLRLCDDDYLLFAKDTGEKFAVRKGSKQAPAAQVGVEPGLGAPVAKPPKPYTAASAAQQGKQEDAAAAAKKVTAPAVARPPAAKLTGAAKKAADAKASAEKQAQLKADQEQMAKDRARTQAAQERAAERARVAKQPTKATPSDPAQVVGPPLHETVAANVAAAKQERSQAAELLDKAKEAGILHVVKVEPPAAPQGDEAKPEGAK